MNNNFLAVIRGLDKFKSTEQIYPCLRPPDQQTQVEPATHLPNIHVTPMSM